MYPTREELGVSTTMLKILERESIIESTSILRVRGLLMSYSNDNDDVGCNRSRGRGALTDTFSIIV
jgi:hypothetical protein